MTERARKRWFGFWDTVGSRLYVITHHTDYDLLELMLFAAGSAFLLLLILPIQSSVHNAILPIAPEWMWSFTAGAALTFKALGWFMGCKPCRWYAGLIGVVLWMTLFSAAVRCGGLWLMSAWTFVFALASALVFWRAGDEL